MEESLSKKKSDKKGDPPCQCRWKAIRQFGILAQEESGKIDQPKKERGFFRINFSVEMRQNPISCLPHFPSNDCVSSLVGLPEIPSSQIEEEEKRSNGENDKKVSCPDFHEFEASLESSPKKMNQNWYDNIMPSNGYEVHGSTHQA
jgi:hypothetical protein